MEIQKVLAQSSPSSGVLTDIYTCGSASGAVVSSLMICNRSPSLSVNVRVSIAVGGASDTLSQYIYYDLPIPANDTFVATVGISLQNGDVLRVFVSSAIVSFNVFGVEIN